MEEDIQTEQVDLPMPAKGVALLNALFLRAAMANMTLFNRRVGRYHEARAQRAKHRIATRKAKRKGN